MICWNVCDSKIETRYDGQVFEFAPNETKRILNPDVYNHLFFKLKAKGLVLVDETKDNPEYRKGLLIEGLRSRWETLDRVVRNFRTMNMEYKLKGMGEESPSRVVTDCILEASKILKKLKELETEKFNIVEDYLKDDNTVQAAKLINESEEKVETVGVFETKVTGKRPGRPKRESVTPA